MRTFTHIQQFENFLIKNILNKPIRPISLGDQAIGHTLENSIFKQVMGKGVKDLVIMKNMRHAGWDYEIKSFTYVTNKLHILRKSKSFFTKKETNWLEESYNQMRRCYLFEAEKNNDDILFKKCWKLTGLIKSKFVKFVQSRFSYTHNATEVYLSKPTDVNYIYKKIKEVK
jgi:hypothetical protein